MQSHENGKLLIFKNTIKKNDSRPGVKAYGCNPSIQKGLQFEASLGYIASSRPTQGT
jgi:hypothetical protein